MTTGEPATKAAKLGFDDLKPDGLQLIGTSDTASDLLAILEDAPLFKDAVFISTITKDKEGKEKFRIGLSFEQ